MLFVCLLSKDRRRADCLLPSSQSMPLHRAISIPGELAKLSQERVALGDIPLFAVVRRLVFVSNTSPHTLSFHWDYSPNQAARQVREARNVSDFLQYQLKRLVYCVVGYYCRGKFGQKLFFVVQAVWRAYGCMHIIVTVLIFTSCADSQTMQNLGHPLTKISLCAVTQTSILTLSPGFPRLGANSYPDKGNVGMRLSQAPPQHASSCDNEVWGSGLASGLEYPPNCTYSSLTSAVLLQVLSIDPEQRCHQPERSAACRIIKRITFSSHASPAWISSARQASESVSFVSEVLHSVEHIAQPLPSVEHVTQPSVWCIIVSAMDPLTLSLSILKIPGQFQGLER